MIRITVVAGCESFIYDYEGEAELKVGRLESNELTIEHSDVSRTHFSIVPADGGFKVRDHASRNGLRVNRQIVAEAPLKEGDEIAIGPDVTIYFGGSYVEVAPRKAGEPRNAAAKPTSDEEEAQPATPEPPMEPAKEAANALVPKPPVDAPKAPATETAAKEPAAPAPPPEPDSTGAPRPARRARRRAAEKVQSAATIAGIVIFLAGMGYGGLVLLGPGSGSPQAPADSSTEGDRAENRPILPSLDVSSSRAKPPPASAPPKQTAARGAADKEWERLSALDLKGDLLIASLDEFALKYPTSPLAGEARKRAATLRRVSDGGPSSDPGKASPALESEILILIRAGSFAEAAYLASVAPRLGVADEKAADKLKKQAEKAAYDKFVEARERGRALVKEGKPFEAYDFVAQVGVPLRHLTFGAEVDAELTGLRRSVAMALTLGPRGPNVTSTTPTPGGDRMTFDRLVPEAKRALVSCDFDGALEKYRQIMALQLSDEERLEFQWKLLDARRAREVWKLMIDRLTPSPGGKSQPLLITLAQSIQGEVFAADAGGVKIRAILKDEKERPIIEKKWKELPPVQILEMFRGLDLDGDALLAFAAYCFEADEEADAQAALVKIWEKWPAFKAEGAMLLRRRTGLDAAPADLVVYEGKVIPAAERDKQLAQAAERKAETKRVAEELAAAKKEAKAEKYLDLANAYMEAGSFIEARDLLAQIARKYRDTDVGAKAKARWEEPLLRRLTMRKNGRDENRVSICFLAEGYTLERPGYRDRQDSNEDQIQFDKTAERTLKFLDKMEPWTEYTGYFNYYSLNLRSNDRGVSREPGNVKKDTPCGGIVNGGTFTVDHGKARSWVDRFPGPSQAVCIGNDNASVATGGGGVVAVVKGMIDVSGHELGHAFGGLLDEYDFDPGGKKAPPKSPTPIPTQVVGLNVIHGNDKDDMRLKAPWAHWIALSGAANWTGKIVDLFEGAATVPHDMWRAQNDCRMRTSGSPFCCVCMEQMVLRLYQTVRPIDEVDPKDEKLEMAANESLILKATCLKPKSRPLDHKWEIRDVGEQEENPDGTTVVRPSSQKAQKPEAKDDKDVDTPDGRHLYGCKLEKLKAGLYDVTLTVSDPTVWVQQKDRSALQESHTWRVRVRAKK